MVSTAVYPAGAAPIAHDTSNDWLPTQSDRTSLFASPQHSLLAYGQALVLQTHNQHQQLCAQSQALLQQAQTQALPPVLMGMLPFNVNHDSYLFVPQRLHMRGPLSSNEGINTTASFAQSDALASSSARASVSGPTPLRPEPTAAEFETLVASALPHLNDNPLSKIVLARTICAQLAQPLARQQLWDQLLQLNPQGYNFLMNMADHQHDNPCFFGASPELLVRRMGAQVSVNPLAGTAARHPDGGATDQAVGQALLNSPKDRHEHAIVIESVVAALQPFCETLQVPDGPSLATTATLWHLSTPITGTLKAPYASSLELALAMHPTPAVCGAPMLAARDYIEATEPFAREFFTGAVGWNNLDGDGEWAVAIRCGHYQPGHIRLYAGAGIVAESDPTSERIETGNKLRTMLNALGCAPSEIEQSILE